MATRIPVEVGTVNDRLSGCADCGANRARPSLRKATILGDIGFSNRRLVVSVVFAVCVGLPRIASGQTAGEVQRATYNATFGNSAHPLAPLLQWARQESAGIGRNIADYSATLVSRERSDGKLGDYESVFLKIRHRPFSVYAYVVSPEDRKGDEAIYVEGRNDGKLLGHTTGITGRMLGTVSLDPGGPIAMQGQNHPITDIGILNLSQRLVRIAENDIRYSESQVRFVQGVKVNDRAGTCIEWIHPTPRRNFRFHILRVFVDDQLKLPIRSEKYDWPKQAGAAPELIEEYTYLNLKLNNGFTDADFDARNPRYAFP